MPSDRCCCAACRHWSPDWASEYDTWPQGPYLWPKVTNVASHGYCGADINALEIDGERWQGGPGIIRTRHDASCPAFDPARPGEGAD